MAAAGGDVNGCCAPLTENKPIGHQPLIRAGGVEARNSLRVQKYNNAPRTARNPHATVTVSSSKYHMNCL